MAEMQPTTEILKNIRKNSTKNKEEVFTRLYRYMLRKDLYYAAYQNLYANNGAGTKGVNDDTADGFSEEKIENIISALKTDTYQPKPAKRTYIRKRNGKMRPLGIPTFTDKLVQEVLRLILESVYEPVFLKCSHGFRPQRSCHTALVSLKKEFNGVRWFVEGDIKGCFDNIDHHTLIKIKSKLSEFIATRLKMTLSKEKTLITHSSECARFLGYDVRVRRNSAVKRGSRGHITMRTLNNKTELLIPQKDKIRKFLFDRKIVKQDENGQIVPISRVSLVRCTELEIVSQFNAELRGICNYYSIASNYCILNYFAYLMERSCLKTLAHKLRSTSSKVKERFRDGHDKWGIPYETKEGKKCCYFADYMDCKGITNGDELPNPSRMMHGYIRTTLEQRLSARKCELCGTTEARYYEIHHVNKVKNLKGKEFWEQVMIAKRRKTLVLCKECHDKIHGKNSSKK